MTDRSSASSVPRMEHWRREPGVCRAYGGAGAGDSVIIGQPGVWSAGGRLIIVVRVVSVVRIL